MALLYERSRVWRIIVHATKDPRLLGLFFSTSVGGATLLAWGSQAATDVAARDTREELEDLKARDYETARYSRHSKAALQQMFDHVRGESSGKRDHSGDALDAAEKPQIKLPGIAWHPKAVEREKQAAAKNSAAPSVDGVSSTVGKEKLGTGTMSDPPSKIGSSSKM